MNVVFLILFIVTLSVIVLFLARIHTSFDTRVFRSKLHVNPLSFVQGKVDCDRVKTTCSNDGDCLTTCLTGLSCIRGTCQTRYETKQVCNAHKGQVATYQFVPETFSYESLCLSVDPGVALDDGTNLFCQGGSTTINYVNSYPNECTCPPGETILPIWGNLNRRQTYGCTKSQIFKREFDQTHVVDHI